MVDALALEADEGRVLNHEIVGKTLCSRFNRRSPNGKTHSFSNDRVSPFGGRKLGELKHLSTRRKRDLLRYSVSSGERKRRSPNPPIGRGFRTLHNFSFSVEERSGMDDHRE